MDGIGMQLRAARYRMGLTLREVEERSSQLAQRWGHAKDKISASWLDRVERENRGLSATKFIVLASIYNLTSEQMLALCPNESGTAHMDRVTRPNATVLFAQGPLEQHAKFWLPDRLVTEPPPEHTVLLPSEQTLLPANYRRGIIGRKDRVMEPMILPGSIVLIDTHRRAIASRREWSHEFDRPIYFLFTRAAYVCGFCELDKKTEWLTLVPHMLSPQVEDGKIRRWRYRKEVEVVGTVAGLFTRRVA